VAIREFLRAGVMKLSPLDLFRGETTPLVAAGMWSNLGSITMLCDFWECARVNRNRGREIVVIEPLREGLVVVICFSLMTP